MIKNYDCSQIENYDILRKVQLTQLEILKKIDNFCKSNGIRYSLAYGTMLGAVRHGGFIPWDDDMDICMPREDYDKFLSCWKDTDEFLLQNHKTNYDFKQTFSKIRKKNTAFVQKTEIGKNYQKGIFVDIFPMDRKPLSRLKKYKQMNNIMMYQLFMRGYVPENNGFLIKLGSKLILKMHSKNKYDILANKHLNKIVKYNDNSKLPFCDTCTFSDMHKSYDNDLFDELDNIEFENETFSVVKNYRKFLSECYGDYMKLPPKNEQTWFHHPVYIDTTSEYRE
nr:LicD family protein [uncultured Ruminococcus sp.]